MTQCSFWFRPGTIKLIEVSNLKEEVTLAAPPGIEPMLFVRRPDLDKHVGKPVYVRKELHRIVARESVQRKK
jgi:hypothetical protein